MSMIFKQSSSSQQDKTLIRLKILAFIAVMMNTGFWFYSKEVQGRWLNVPPVPPRITVMTSTLGDTQFGARMIAIMLQNLGNTGGRVTPITNYDFEKLADWMNLHYELDAQSDIVPYLAAHYFSASQDPQKIFPIIKYLQKAGNSPEGEKWRWLAQAAYLARFKFQDLDLALELAEQLANIQNDNIPEWARQLPASVLNAKGEKEAALSLLLGILKDKADKLRPEEINNTMHYICEQILSEEEAKAEEMCKQL